MLIEFLTGLALVVLVPMALGSAEFRSSILLSVAGALASTAFLLDEGVAAAVAALVWTLTVGWVVLGEVRRTPNAFSVRAALRLWPHLHLLFGTLWLVLSRYGARPLGFSSTIVALTAVHFHYAGFIAPTLISKLEQQLSSSPRNLRLVQLTRVGVLAATPLTAAGITLTPVFGALGASLFGIGLGISSLVTLIVTRSLTDRVGVVLLRISAASVLVAMVLAVLYAVGQWLGTPAPTIATMTRTHGLLNALGYSLAGLIGWKVVEPDSS